MIKIVKSFFLIVLIFSSINCIAQGMDNKVFIPNIFTPNGDGINDTLQIADSNLVSFEWFIYNRYGRVMVSLNKQFKYWTGLNTVGQQAVESGTYYYQFTGLTTNDEKISKTGYIYLTK